MLEPDDEAAVDRLDASVEDALIGTGGGAAWPLRVDPGVDCPPDNPR